MEEVIITIGRKVRASRSMSKVNKITSAPVPMAKEKSRAGFIPSPKILSKVEEGKGRSDIRLHPRVSRSRVSVAIISVCRCARPKLYEKQYQDVSRLSRGRRT
jgi:hypothetical protein